MSKDADTITDLPAGEQERLAQLWTQAQPTVASFLNSMVRDFHEAEDLLQKVAVTLVRKFDQYDDSRPFIAWALGIAKLDVMNHRRTKARRAHAASPTDGQLLDQIIGVYVDLEDELEEVRGALQTCLKKVPDDNRAILDLRYEHNLSPTRIAEQVKMKPGTVRVMLHRIRDRLKQCVERRMKSITG